MSPIAPVLKQSHDEVAKKTVPPTALAEVDRHHHLPSLGEENKYLNKFLNFSMENRSKEDRKVARLLKDIEK